MHNNTIGPAGARALGSSTHLGRLTRLDLSRNPIGDEGARALAQAQHWQHLTHLVLSSCGVQDRGAAAFIDAAPREGLEILDLTDNRFRSATCRELRGRFGAHVLLSE
jgi:Ran GTPase-activating protein (RanGAP) involved in mRNA processing and transport